MSHASDESADAPSREKVARLTLDVLKCPGDLLLPKPTSEAGCQDCATPGLGDTVRPCPPASMVGSGDSVLTWLLGLGVLQMVDLPPSRS